MLHEDPSPNTRDARNVRFLSQLRTSSGSQQATLRATSMPFPIACRDNKPSFTATSQVLDRRRQGLGLCGSCSSPRPCGILLKAVVVQDFGSWQLNCNNRSSKNELKSRSGLYPSHLPQVILFMSTLIWVERRLVQRSCYQQSCCYEKRNIPSHRYSPGPGCHCGANRALQGSHHACLLRIGLAP